MITGQGSQTDESMDDLLNTQDLKKPGITGHMILFIYSASGNPTNEVFSGSTSSCAHIIYLPAKKARKTRRGRADFLLS